MKKIKESIITLSNPGEYKINIDTYGVNGEFDKIMNDILRKKLNKSEKTEFMKEVLLDKTEQWNAITPIGTDRFLVEIFLEN